MKRKGLTTKRAFIERSLWIFEVLLESQELTALRDGLKKEVISLQREIEDLERQSSELRQRNSELQQTKFIAK
jgi:hypothetical protein